MTNTLWDVFKVKKKEGSRFKTQDGYLEAMKSIGYIDDQIYNSSKNALKNGRITLDEIANNALAETMEVLLVKKKGQYLRGHGNFPGEESIKKNFPDYMSMEKKVEEIPDKNI